MFATADALLPVVAFLSCGPVTPELSIDPSPENGLVRYGVFKPVGGA
jgi:hypothetical protein